MKIEWLVTNVTAVGSPGRAESTICQIVKIEWLVANVTAVGFPGVETPS